MHSEAMYPPIDSPCPIEFSQLPTSGNFHCSSCDRQVHDISHLNQEQRREFLSQCEGKVCVSYTIGSNTIAKASGIKNAALAAALIIAGTSLPAAATETDKNLVSASGSEVAIDIIYTGIRGGIDNPITRSLEKTPTQSPAQSSLELIPTVQED